MMIGKDPGFKDALKDCYIVARKEDEPLFNADGDKIRCRLYRYAVIPLEEYETVMRSREEWKVLAMQTAHETDWPQEGRE